MRRMIIIVTLLLAVCTGAFAASKAAAKSVKPQPSSTGILFAQFFEFGIVGDGVSTTFTINPRRIPPQYTSGGASYPNLPLVSVDSNGGNCGDSPFTATLSNGLLTLSFTTAPPANGVEECGIFLFFQPE
jgi:hypothetical protein